MTVRTLEQKRAEYAWKVISTLKDLKVLVKKEDNKTEERSKYNQEKLLTLFRKLPSMIMHNGLVTTLVFLRSKSVSNKEIKEEGVVLYSLIYYLQQVKEHGNDSKYNQARDEVGGKLKNLSTRELEEEYKAYFQNLFKKSFTEYRYETKKALNIAQWLKRIAEGEIEDEGKGSD